MKKLMLLLLAGVMVFAVGCKKEEDKSPEQVKADVQKMSAEDLQEKVDELNAEIKTKTEEKAGIQKQLGGGMLDGLAGKKPPENADELKAKDKELTECIAKLKENLAIYSEELAKKK